MSHKILESSMDAMTSVDKNNFDGVRIGLALIVVFAHLSALTELSAFSSFGKYFDSDFAVKGFFAISGFLVMKSYFNSPTLTDFCEKRFRRIYPAYLCAILLCLTIGVWTTKLPLADFFISPQTIKYLLVNAAMLNFLQPTLPLTFEGNPVSTLNGSLWTIKVEVSLYLLVPTLFWLFTRFQSTGAALVLAVASSLWVYFFKSHYTGGIGAELSRQFPGQLSYFALGSVMAINKKIFEKQLIILCASAALFLATSQNVARLFFEPFFYSSLVLFLSTKASRNLNVGRYGDISYGIYLYHFPIIQIFVYFKVFQDNPYLGLLATFALTVAAALCSWHFIEKRFLKRSSHYLAAATR